jgi:putative acetyltransferase
MKIRIADEKDIENIAQLFYETINVVNKKDYSDEQIIAWSGNAKNLEMWSDLIKKQHFLVAQKGYTIIGFASLDVNHCVDFMYVHKDFQGQQIATKLLSALESKAIKEGLQKYGQIQAYPQSLFF